MADNGSGGGGIKQAADPAAQQHHEVQFAEDNLQETLSDNLGDSLADPLTVQQAPGDDPAAPPPGDPSSPMQFSGGGASAVKAAAAKGISGLGGSLPFASQIQSSFGGHDVSSVQAHTGSTASAANQAMGSNAFATGNHVAFKGAPDLHTAAHEAAHVVQQRAGVNLPSGVGKAGDSYERHADTVADAVVQGKSAAPMLDQFTGGNAKGAAAVQRDVQMSWLGDLADGAANLAGRAINAGAEMVSNAVNAVFRWIDLMGAKTRLLGKIMDTGWVTKATSGIKSNPHPKHRGMVKLSVDLVMLKCRAEAWAKAASIAGCDTLKEVQALDKAVDVWRSKRGVTLKKQVEGKIKEYRDVEKKWLAAYTAPKTHEAKGAVLNKLKHRRADVTLTTGMASKVGLTSRVKMNFKLTDKATTEGKSKWKKAEKDGMIAKVQKQIDAVWGPGNQLKPFKVIEPEDHLLEKEAQKWSAITATFHPKVVNDDKKFTHTINFWREGTGENKRADAGNLYEADSGTTNYKKKANADGSFSPKTMNTDQLTQAHEFGHFGMALPDEYLETSNVASTTPEKKRTPWQKVLRKRFAKVMTEYDTKIADAKKQIAANPNKTDADKKTKAEWENKLKWYEHDRKVLNSPRSRSFGKGKWADKDPDIYRLDPNNPARTAGNAPPPPPKEAFAEYGHAGDHYAPGRRFARNQRVNETSKKDRPRIMIGGNKVEAYHFEPVLEVVNTLVAGKYDPGVKFEHNVKKGSEQWKVMQDVRKWNKNFTDLGKLKEKKEVPAPAAKKGGDAKPA